VQEEVTYAVGSYICAEVEADLGHPKPPQLLRGVMPKPPADVRMPPIDLGTDAMPERGPGRSVNLLSPSADDDH
jgi:hypothetical protein